MKWQARYAKSLFPHLVITGIRRGNRGQWKLPNQAPEYVQDYFGVEKENPKGTVYQSKDFSELAELDNLGSSENIVRGSGMSRTVLSDIDVPSHLRKKPKRTIPKGVPAIRNLRGLMNFFYVDAPQNLNRRIYKFTDCGASISVQTPDGKWHHNGQDWSNIKEIRSFTIQSIVEGSDAEVSSEPFDLPVTHAEVQGWMSDMEHEVDRLWTEANQRDLS